MNLNQNIKKYEPLTIDELNKRLSTIENLWKQFLDSEGIGNLDYHIHKQNMFEVIQRQDERMYYLNIFHNLKYPCEYKYLAIECFWINTLKPFMVTDEKSEVYNCPNEMFSLFLIISLIRKIFEIYKKDEKFSYPTVERMRDILYDFKFCSMSREAMISFVETFADNYGVGIDFLQKNKKNIKKLLENSDFNGLWEN